EVGGAADLEGSAALQVFALEEDAGAGFGVEPGGSEHGRAAGQGTDPHGGGAHIFGLDGERHPFESISRGNAEETRRSKRSRRRGSEESELRSDGKLKHAPPMRRSGLGMAKLQVRAALGWTRQSLIPLAGRPFSFGEFAPVAATGAVRVCALRHLM